ncbi:CRISPR-associated endoribonuclease Cas6 [Sulfurisphaera javensis]|uniref:CRISPR-associated endoribonuclease Cas6 n=1 Tax=Sulfurisphaera javensis TaxID=2049879 RepID=A0AAT9GVM0_9CREN
MIFILNFELTPSHDAIIPPFTSKLSRTLFLEFSPSYSKLIESEESYKPIRITVVKDEGKPLYSTGKRKITLTGGKTYSFSVSTMREEIVKEAIKVDSVKKELFNTTFDVQLKDVKIKEDVGLEDSRFYKVYFRTPALIQPPRPRIKNKMNRYVLFPYVPLFLASLVSHWNKNMSEKIVGLTGSKTLYYFREVNYRLKPVTVYYGNIPNRGFIGWVIYELRAKRGSKIRENVKKLLDYGNYFGVGKSRNIGFGEIEVKLLSENDK